MDEFSKGQYPSKSIQSLPKSIQSLLGFKAQLTPSWIESVCRIINELPKLKEAESEKNEYLAKIQGDISLLNAHFNKLNIERRRALNEYLDLKGNIRVFCRIRPLLGDERYGNERPVVTSDSSNVLLKITDSKSKQYNFDTVFPPHSTQDEVFSEIEPVIKSALDGYNICLFAYGQTGTGKTYTMEGRPECPGVVPRGIEALFEQALESNYKFQFTFSMLEIYMGSLRDLLIPQSTKLRVPKPPCLSIQMDPNGSIEIENLAAVKVNDFEQVRKLYRLGSRCRSTAPTMANSTSSRSHCLIRISITSSGASGRRRETNKMWMVDLGGSERLLKTQASGRRLEEGKAINLSLSALGDVISALQSKKPHVPYRNTKLTQVLRDSLGLDSKTLMLVHVSPKDEDVCETICSLGFATRARGIHLGSEEPLEMRAKKELAMAELLQKVKDFESERQDVKRDIERLNKRLKNLMGDEPSTEGNHDSSNPSAEQMRPNGKDKVQNVKGSTRTSANLPRFMRPTICSRRKTGTDLQISLSTSRKPPIPPKTRKPSSVYAESVTYPAKSEVWQSEQGSECIISAIRHLNWHDSADDGTEFSQETSEYEIKKVIFPGPEKSPRSLIDSLSDETANELEPGRASRLNPDNNFVIDNWLQLQMQEENNSYTKWNNRVLAIPTDAKNVSSDTKETLNDLREEFRLHKTAENFDEDMMTGEPHKSMALGNTQKFTDSLSSDLKNKKCHQNNDSDQRDQRIKCTHKEPECTCSSFNDEIGSETYLRERITPVSKESSTLVNTYSDDLIGSMKHKHNRDSEELCLLSMRCRKSLLMDEDKTTLDQKSAALEDSAEPIADFQEDKHEKGTNWLLGQTFRMLWGSALLGLGICSLGFEHDFFQGLMF